MAAHNELGKRGEKIAEDFLLENGYKIRHTNWKSGKNELDIVAEKENILVFVEVKTRSSNWWGNPEEFVHKAKARRTRSAANHYIESYELNLEPRFDIISVLKNSGGTFEIEHIEDAFRSW